MSHPTEQQQQAIEARGAVLLAAGAGTGKTATLINRCLRLVAEEGVEVDRLLVVTFTNAAAAEMKQRLREALRERAAAEPHAERLQRQLLLLEGAHISTIHAFCLELLRAHFADLGLDPGVVVLDESVAVPLARSTVRQVITVAIAAGTGTQALAEKYCGGSGERLGELILRTHRFFVTQPQAEALLQQQLDFFAADSPGLWRERRREITAAWVRESAPLAQAQIPRALQALQSVRGYGGKSPTAQAIRNLESLLPAFAARLAALSSETPADDLTSLLERATELGGKEIWVRGTGAAREQLEDFFEEAAQLRSWHPAAEFDPLDEEWARARGPMRSLLELARDFASEFASAKRALGGIDFADLEQLALRLLVEDGGQATIVADQWRERLDHVFVDECQDINAAQDALLRALARGGERANLFMVGDVKQSIYRFRMAAPELFREHAEAWEGREHHQVLPLTENFRSREAILAFVNDLFGCLMAPRLGGVGYGPGERLAFALPDKRSALSLNPPTESQPCGAWPEPGCRVELHLVLDEKPDAQPDAQPEESEEDDGGWGDLLSLERQAHVAAARLRELMDGQHEVFDGRVNCFRRMQWSDVGLLMRSVTGRSASFLREFRRLGIPLAVEQGDFLETLEASDLAALLRILDNPRQDIPLFAVLRSPLVGWTLEELVQLHSDGRGSGAWDRLEAAARESGETGEKVRAFIANLTRWRRLALMTSLTCVLETVLAETRYEAFLFTLADGPDRVANVRRFLDLARRYDPLQRQGLFRFLRFLDEQKAAGREIEPLPARQVEAVQLLSIHKSKGLEFPVVVLAGIGAAFQSPELKAPILLSRRWGLAPQVVDLQAQRRNDSLMLWQAKREEKLASLAEELRLFYVAVTRARDTLLLVGSFKPDSKAWQSRMSLPPAIGVARARSYCEWIGRWLGEGIDWRAGCGEVLLPSGTTAARLRWRTYSGTTTHPLAEAASAGPASLEPSPTSVTDAQLALFGWRYPHEAATGIPAKTSASALRRLGMEPDEEAAAPWQPRREFRSAAPALPGGLSATEIGTAHHVFFQHVDLARTASEADLGAELERLVSRRILTGAEAGSLNLASILGFWGTGLGAAIREHATSVRRELPFTAAFSPAELPPYAHRFTTTEGDDDLIVVQGAVDLAVLLPQEMWVVDFKTDRISEADLPARAHEHASQLRLYGAALERIFRRPVTRCVLYFIALRRCWDVENPMGGASEPGPEPGVPAREPQDNPLPQRTS